MSLQSMTGFGRGIAEGKNYIVTAEVKSVNNRFKETRFKMSSLFNSKEMIWRNKLDQFFKRGTFDISLSYQQHPSAKIDFSLDSKKVEVFLEEIKKITKENLQINPVDFLRNEFQRDDNLSKQEELLPLAEQAVYKAYEDLLKSRQNEGKKLLESIYVILDLYSSYLKKCDGIRSQYPEMLKAKLNQKLNEKLKDIKIDEGRQLQEVIYYLEKLEVDEEITRANIHLGKLKEILSSNGEVGRQIDFLLQELGRETNTLGSKSGSPEISQNVVEMKVHLEKIREQALNLE